MINLTCQDNETLDRILAVTRAVGWGGAKILQSYHRGEQDLAVNKKKKGGPVTAADLAANNYILGELQTNFSDIDFGYLSEETHQGNEAIPMIESAFLKIAGSLKIVPLDRAEFCIELIPVRSYLGRGSYCS